MWWHHLEKTFHQCIPSMEKPEKPHHITANTILNSRAWTIFFQPFAHESNNSRGPKSTKHARYTVQKLTTQDRTFMPMLFLNSMELALWSWCDFKCASESQLIKRSACSPLLSQQLQLRWILQTACKDNLPDFWSTMFFISPRIFSLESDFRTTFARVVPRPW